MQALVVLFRIMIGVIAIVGLAAVVVIALAATAKWGTAAGVVAGLLGGMVLVLSLGLSATLLRILDALEEIAARSRSGATSSLRVEPAIIGAQKAVVSPPVVRSGAEVGR